MVKVGKISIIIFQSEKYFRKFLTKRRHEIFPHVSNIRDLVVKRFLHKINPSLKSTRCVRLHLLHMIKVSIQKFSDWQGLRKIN